MADQTSIQTPSTPTIAVLGWHGEIIGHRDVAREAFEDTIRYLRAEFQGQVDDLAWLKTFTSVEDVQIIVKEAQDKHKSAGKSKTRGWLEKLSSVVLYYNGALDMLAQQHPEYLSLVWGTLKFILMGIANRAELESELAKAMVDIAEVLPRAKLNAELYQTDHVRAAISTLTRKIISSILNPFKLGLKTTVDEVKRCATVLDAAADSASKAEMRTMHVLMHEIFGELTNMRTRFESLSTSLNDRLEVAAWSKPVLEDIRLQVRDMRPRIIDIQFNQAMGILKPRISPVAALRKQQSIARRSQPWMSSHTEILNLLTRIGDWIFSPKSSLLLVEAPARAENKAKETAIELIGMLQPTATRVSWYLSTKTSADHGVTIDDIFKGLAYQLISLDPHNINKLLDGNLTAMKLQQEHSEREWTDLLYIILKHLTECFIVIEAEDVYKTMGQEASFLESILSSFRRLISRASEDGLRVKILIVGYGKLSNHGLESSTKEPTMNIVSLQPSVPVPASRRRGGARSAFQSPGWLNLRYRVSKNQ